MANWTSREKAVSSPGLLTVLNYLIGKHGVPRITLDRSGIIYHYTDAKGLFGIVQSSRLWATDTAFLNDPTEGSYALDVVRELLETYEPSTDPERKLIDGVLARLGKRGEDLFVVSFCRDGDLLSQWRGYGAFGAGYALGFDLSQITAEPLAVWLLEIIYDDSHLRSTISEILSIFVDNISASDEIDIDNLIENCAEVFYLTTMGYKHPSYREEQELRILVRRDRYAIYQNGITPPFRESILYRSRGSEVLPYLSVGLNFPNEIGPEYRLPLKRIVLGPGVPFDRNSRSLRDLLTASGHEGVAVVQSRIPFQP